MHATTPKLLTITPGDKLFAVPAAIEKLTGQRPHPTTTCRYCLRGAAGVVLPSLIISGRRMTSLEALQDWYQAVTDARNARS